jgi:hypothetical protein
MDHTKRRDASPLAAIYVDSAVLKAERRIAGITSSAR